MIGLTVATAAIAGRVVDEIGTAGVADVTVRVVGVVTVVEGRVDLTARNRAIPRPRRNPPPWSQRVVILTLRQISRVSSTRCPSQSLMALTGLRSIKLQAGPKVRIETANMRPLRKPKECTVVGDMLTGPNGMSLMIRTQATRLHRRPAKTSRNRLTTIRPTG